MIIENSNNSELSSSNKTFCIILALNFLILALGLLWLILSFLLWDKVGHFNSFLFFLILIACYLLGLSVFAFIKIKNSESSLLWYFILLTLTEIGFLIFAIYLYNNKLNLIAFFIKNMDDSYEAILRATWFVAKNLDMIKVTLIIYLVLLGIQMALSLIYRNEVITKKTRERLLFPRSIND